MSIRNIARSTTVLVVTMVLLGIVGTDAYALTLNTPLVNNYGTLAFTNCVVTNVDSKPIEVTSVTIFDFAGTALTPSANGCPSPPATLAAHASCEVQYNSFGSTWCSATTKGKFRLSLNSMDGSNGDTRAVIAGTK